MKTIIVLILLAIAGIVLLAVVAAVYTLAAKSWQAARSVWRRLIPLAIGLSAGMLVLAFVFTADIGAAAPDIQAVVGLAIALGVSITAYISSGKWFADNRSANYYPRPEHAANTTAFAAAITVSSDPFRRLPNNRRFWERAVDDRREARLKHVVAYLRAAVPEERASLDFSEAAILRLWGSAGDLLDGSFIALCGDILVWLNESEASLEDTQARSRAHHLLQCERLTHGLESIAVKSRRFLVSQGNALDDVLHQRSDRIADL